MLFFSLGGVWVLSFFKDKPLKEHSKKIMIVHGIGSALALMGGFGLLAKLGIHGSWPSWIIIKLGILLVLIASISLFKRKLELTTPGLFVCFIMSIFAIYLAQVKTLF